MDNSRSRVIIHRLPLPDDSQPSHVVDDGLPDMLHRITLLFGDGDAVKRTPVIYGATSSTWITIPAKLSVKDSQRNIYLRY